MEHESPLLLLYCVCFFLCLCWYLLYIFWCSYVGCLGFPGGSVVRNPPPNAGDSEMGSIPGLGRSLEGAMATHSHILAWIIPWTEKPGGLLSMGSWRVTWLCDWMCTHHVGASVFTKYCILLQDWTFYSYNALLCVLLTVLVLKSHLSKCCYPSIFVSIFMVYLFPSLHFDQLSLGLKWVSW